MILIAGASGLLGANLALTAVKQGREVVCVYREHALTLPGATTIKCDLTDAAAVASLVKTTHPQAIINCAALTDIDYCESHPEEARRINTDLACCLAAHAANVRAQFAHVSTDAVFNGKCGNASEEDSTSPLSEYARTKAAAEAAVREAVPSALIVRTNIYGWNFQEKRSLAEWMLSRLESGQLLYGFTDIIFSPMLVNHLAEVLLEMMGRGISGLYHVAGGASCSKYDFARYIADVFGLDASLVVPSVMQEAGLKAPRGKNLSLDTAKITRELGRSLPDVHTGLQRFKFLRDSGYVQELKSLRGREHAHIQHR